MKSPREKVIGGRLKATMVFLNELDCVQRYMTRYFEYKSPDQRYSLDPGMALLSRIAMGNVLVD
jgi:hypothetical protein